jgi:inhibitor of KinA
VSSAFTISQLGDQALTIQLGTSIDEAISERCLSLAQHINDAAITGIKDIIPSYNTVSVIYDAVYLHSSNNTASPSALLKRQLTQCINTCNWQHSHITRPVTVPVCFDLSLAPDLELLAQSANINVDEFIQKFTASPYRVFMLGFLPGFAYMGKVSDDLAAPRKQTPHLNIPAGSVGIAGNQTGIYPMNSPGGWNIIGRTPIKMFDLSTSDPCFLKAGDKVTFQPITIQEFHHLNQDL